MKAVVLASGSEGNSTFFSSRDVHILLDIGKNAKYIKEKIIEIGEDPKKIDAIIISHTHDDHVSALKVFLKNNHPKVYITEKMYYDLIKQGCHPRKSLDMIFPGKEIVPDNLLKHFLRGYVDGDGYIGIDFISRKDGSIRVKGRMSITCGDANFIYDLIKTAQWPEMTLQEDKRSSAKSMEWTGEKCFNILTFLYEDAHIYLDRKYEKYIELKNARSNQES